MDAGNAAPVWRRLVAIAIDYAAVGALGLLLAQVFYEPLVAAGEYARLAGLAIVIAYFGWFNSWLGGGGTPGKRLLGLRVLKSDGSHLSPGAAAVRGVIVCLPLLFSNFPLRGEAPALAVSAVSLLGFGIPLASLYLLFFNRSGRVLHDYAVSSVVSSGGAPNFPDAVWWGHYANTALICLGAAAYPFFTVKIPLVASVQRSVEALPEVETANVLLFTGWNSKSAPHASSWLDVDVRLEGAHSNLSAIAGRLEKAVFEGHEAEIGARPVTVHIKFGAGLGIASLTKTPLNIAIGPFSMARNVQLKTSLAQWRRHTGEFERSKACADKAHPDAVIGGCSFFLSLPNRAPMQRLAAYINRAAAYITKGEPDLAIGDYSKALELAPAEAKAGVYDLRAFAYRAKGDLESALPDAERVVKIKPNAFAPYFNRGVTYFGLGRFEEAAQDFRHALGFKEDAYAAIFNFLSLERAGNSGTAALEAYASKSADKKWPFPVIEFYLGRASSESLLTAATGDETCEAIFYLGQWQFLKGHRQEAADAMRKAAGSCPKSFIEYAAALAELKRQGG